MARIPLALLLAASAAAPILACRDEAATVEPTAGLPFVRGAEGGDFAMVSESGDTIWFRAHLTGDGPYIRYVRFRRAEGGLDSLAATIDVRNKAPVASHQRRHVAGGFVAADLLYGAGFEGQARLTLSNDEGQLVDNLRTPAPHLDSAQIPQTLAALDFSRPDTFTFSYVAPFEKAALNAQLVLGPLDTLDLATGPAPAHAVTLRYAGIEERFWFAAPPGRYRLLRWHEVTRGVTWTRAEP